MLVVIWINISYRTKQHVFNYCQIKQNWHKHQLFGRKSRTPVWPFLKTCETFSCSRPAARRPNYRDNANTELFSLSSSSGCDY